MADSEWFAGFYTSPLVWFVSKPEPIDGYRYLPHELSLAFESSAPSHCLKVCRDGLIMLSVAELEVPYVGPDRFESKLSRMGNYLDHLNVFYMLLDAACFHGANTSVFQLEEITHRAAIRVELENGKIVFDSEPSSIQSWFHHSARYGSLNPAQFFAPYTVPERVIADAAATYATAAEMKLVSRLAAYAKSLTEYKAGNSEISLVLAWFVVEAGLHAIWNRHLDEANVEFPSGKLRINSERRKRLTGRDMPISTISNVLELAGVLTHDELEQLDYIRGLRNDVVHQKPEKVTSHDALKALRVAEQVFEKAWKFPLQANLSIGYTW